jgi:hypothetical protein
MDIAWVFGVDMVRRYAKRFFCAGTHVFRPMPVAKALVKAIADARSQARLGRRARRSDSTAESDRSKHQSLNRRDGAAGR